MHLTPFSDNLSRDSCIHLLTTLYCPGIRAHRDTIGLCEGLHELKHSRSLEDGDVVFDLVIIRN